MIVPGIRIQQMLQDCTSANSHSRYLCVTLQHLFIASSRELKRLDSLLMSPIFGHFGESVTGLLTLRAFRRQEIFTATNQRMLDASNRTYWLIQEVSDKKSILN